MIKERIKKIVEDAVSELKGAGELEFQGEFTVELDRPRSEEHGDYASNVALALAKRAGKKPRDLAEAIVGKIPKDAPEISGISVAGPGFINFVVDPKFFLKTLHDIDEKGSEYGSIDIGRGTKVQVEFVSANPTGPLHIGHGRGAVYGDVLGSILTAAGFEVTKEYYVNDVGNQIKTLGRSVYLRVRELSGDAVEFPEECYQGHYIVDLARELIRAHKDKVLAMGEEDAIEFCGDFASEKILDGIKKDLAETGVIHDTYFHENLLHTDAMVESSIAWLRKKGYIYDKDGAIWFETTKFGDDKDRVLRKSDGSLTYFASDIAYHKNKFDRGFDRVIDIWGADHGGYVGRMKAAVAAFGKDSKSLDPVLIQLVNLLKAGEAVSMSTRRATYETLEDVRRDVGKDVCRYFFLMRSHNAQLDFDLELARKETPDNPVFYIQYAHARIASIFRKADEKGLQATDGKDVDLGRLDLPEEYKIARTLGLMPGIIADCAETLEPHKLAFYLLELARMFQSYYSKGKHDERYRILDGTPERVGAKLYLLKNIQIVLQNSLRILGISAPDRMEKITEE